MIKIKQVIGFRRGYGCRVIWLGVFCQIETGGLYRGIDKARRSCAQGALCSRDCEY